MKTIKRSLAAGNIKAHTKQSYCELFKLKLHSMQLFSMKPFFHLMNSIVQRTNLKRKIKIFVATWIKWINSGSHLYTSTFPKIFKSFISFCISSFHWRCFWILFCIHSYTHKIQTFLCMHHLTCWENAYSSLLYHKSCYFDKNFASILYAHIKIPLLGDIVI